MDKLTVEYFGHSCFRLDYCGQRIVLDPYTDGKVPGYPALRLDAEFSFSSHGHGDHCSENAVSLQPCAAQNFTVEELLTDHDDVGGAKRGKNTIRIFTFGALRIAHFGDLGRALTGEEKEKLRGLDCALIPVGGFFTIDAAQAMEIIRELQPRIVIPMHYRTDSAGYDVIGHLDEFLSLWPDSTKNPGLNVMQYGEKIEIYNIENTQGETKKMGIYEELQARGLIAQVTNEPEIREMVNAGKAKFYIGFDCTADSLTAGHFMALTLMKRLQQAGNTPVALIGGGTTMIGDPSGRTDMRKMLTKEDIDHNAECFRRQMEKFIDFGEGKAIMVNNADWLLDLNYVNLLREVGACFSVNNMLRAECYKQRMEKGLSFFEFNYMIMQSYDFYYLFQHYGCNMQFGGDDQWSNMLGGTELIRKKLGKDAHAMTITLLTDSQGKKMGKTAGNAVWLDPNKTSPFEFYQYWRNVGDADVMKCIRMLTFLPLEQINEMDKWEGSDLNRAKEILAFELTKMVHGEEEARKAEESAKALFGGSGDAADMPTTELTDADFTDGSVDILTLLVKTGLCTGKGDARRNVQQGGVSMGEEKITDIAKTYTKADFAEGLILRRGKKNYNKLIVK